MAYLQLKDIRKRFGEIEIIQGIDLAIQQGEFIETIQTEPFV
ncbi:hypothetical protein P3G55_23030 [Leptospira sp. 96542]|nr:hypothetical protein [Leptospira sp. 96542]